MAVLAPRQDLRRPPPCWTCHLLLFGARCRHRPSGRQIHVPVKKNVAYATIFCGDCHNFPCQVDSIRHTLGESPVFEIAFEFMEEPRSDIDFGAFININMDRAVRRLRAVFRAEALHEEGLSVQEWRALLNLARFGDCHLRELARLASLDATHTGRAALELERKGLIRRSDDEHDGRRKRLHVTNAGHEVVDRVWAKALKLDARIQSRLGKTRYNAVKEALAILLEMLAEEGAMQEVHASE